MNNRQSTLKRLSKRNGVRSDSVLAIFLVFFVLCASIAGQTPSKKDVQKIGESPESDAFTKKQQWLDILAELSSEAGTLAEEKNRPYALAEVADAYWNLDENKSIDLFMRALKAGIALQASDSTKANASAAIRYVLALASKRRVSLAKQLGAELAAQQKAGGRPSSLPISAALDLLKSDAETAAELAEAFAPAGLSSDSAGVFILQLAEKDLNASKRVYSAYLAKATSGVPLNELLWLGGYPFGYGETYGFSSRDLARLIGLGGRRIPGLEPDPILAQAFLRISFASVQTTLREAASAASPEQKAALNGLCLFATEYLLPEVAHYAPNAVEAWWLLRHQAEADTSPSQRQNIERELETVNRNRSVARNENQDPQQSGNDTTESDLAEIDKIIGGCQRDVAYAKLVLSRHTKKDESGALRIADHIDTKSLHDGVLQFLSYDLSLSLAELGNWTEASGYAERVAAQDQRGLLYVRMADLALRQKDKVRAVELVERAIHLAADATDFNIKASILLAVAAEFSKIDGPRVLGTLSEAVKAVNHVNGANVDTFRVLRKIDLSCSGDGTGSWYGSSEEAGRFNLMESLAAAAQLDGDGTIVIGRSIDDPATRVRSMASIIRALINTATKGQKKSA